MKLYFEGADSDDGTSAFHRRLTLELDTVPIMAHVIGLFQPHLSPTSSKFCCKYFLRYFTANFSNVRLTSIGVENQLGRLVRRAYVHCQQEMIVFPHRKRFEESGTSATIAIILPSHKLSVIAHIGRSALITWDSRDRPISHTPVHMPFEKSEFMSVIRKGGWCNNDSVCGMAPVTRSLGDLWQIRDLAWQTDSKLRYLSKKTLSQHGITNRREVDFIMNDKAICFVLSHDPHITTVQHADFPVRMCIVSSSFLAANDVSTLSFNAGEDDSSIDEINAIRRPTQASAVFLKLEADDGLNDQKDLTISNPMSPDDAEHVRNDNSEIRFQSESESESDS